MKNNEELRMKNEKRKRNTLAALLLTITFNSICSSVLCLKKT